MPRKKAVTLDQVTEIIHENGMIPCRIVSDGRGTIQYVWYGYSESYDLKQFADEELNVILTSVTVYPENCYIQGISLKNGRSFGHYIPPDFKVRELSKKDHAKVMEVYKELAKKNLANMIPHSFYSGSDPEIFAEDKDGNVIPAFDFLPPKEKPATHAGDGELFWDGFQAEITHSAGSCLDGLASRVRYGLRELYNRLKKHNPDGKLVLKNVVNIQQDVLDNSTDEQVAFGCEPSLNIYGMKGMESDGRSVPFRTTGGHMHFGIGEKSPEVLERIIKALDTIIGVASVSLFEGIDHPRRRLMYGLAGEYRLPSYGIEYRTLSNAWLIHPAITYLVFDIARKAIVMGEKNFLNMMDYDEEEIVRIINQNDVPAAREHLKKNKTIYKAIIKSIYGDGYINDTFEVLNTGIIHLLDDPTNVEKHWQLNNPGYYKGGKRFKNLLDTLKNNGKIGKSKSVEKKAA